MIKELPYGMALRLAEEDDVVHVYELLHEANDNADTPLQLGSFENMKELLIEFINDKNNLALLLLQDDKPVGIMAASKVVSPFWAKPFAVEVVWWVRPNARRGRNPWRMVEAYELWAKTVGCHSLRLSILSKLSRRQWKRWNRIYKKRGYKDQETLYIKEIE